MFENIAAIDIGTSSIKVVAVKTSFKNYQIKSFIIRDIEFEDETNSKKIIEALERIKEEIDLSDYTILTNIPMEKFILRNLTFPFKDPVKISEILPFEAEEHIPHDISDVIIDFQTINNKNDEEGKIFFAATHKLNIEGHLNIFNKNNININLAGIESNALLECYEHYSEIEEEFILQIHIGHSKTIVNMISDHNLLFSRIISLGLQNIFRFFSNIIDEPYERTVEIFQNLNIDLTSFENNIQRGYYKNLGISKKDFKDIYNFTTAFFHELYEQVRLSKKAFDLEFPINQFNRIMISGGGSNITGVGNIISDLMNAPVVSLPFPNEYNDENIKSIFPIALGTILSYLNHKQYHIDMLKDEFSDKKSSNKNKKYHLAIFFMTLASIALIINLTTSSIIRSSKNQAISGKLEERFKSKFRIRTIKTDAITDARKLLVKEKKDLKEINSLIGGEYSFTNIIGELLTSFPSDDSWEIKSLTVQKKSIDIKGKSNSSAVLEKYKENLLATKKYDSVTIRILSSKNKSTRFHIKIKKITKNKAKRKGK